jgi:hypothetical protein
VIFNQLNKTGALLTIGCLTFSTFAFAQDKANTTSSQSDTSQQQDTNTNKKKKKDKKSKQKAKKDNSSGHPMDERPPIGPNQPGRMDNPTIPQRTPPGQQPAPGSPDPTSPTTTPR